MRSGKLGWAGRTGLAARVSRVAVAGLCLGVGLGAGLSGCIGYSPGGNMASNDEYTYWSTPHLPQTVTLIDTRTGEKIWTYEIPVGKQLVMHFYTDEYPGANFTDSMRWDIMDVETSFGHMKNEMPVPGHFARRVDVEVRPSPEAAPPSTTTASGGAK